MSGSDKNTPLVQDYSEVTGRYWVYNCQGLVEQKELLPGVCLAGSLVKVENGCVITSVLNTTEKEVNKPEPAVMVTEVDTGDPLVSDPKSPAEWDKSRYERVLNKLRMDHLNSEEKTSLGEMFRLSGCVLSSGGLSELY